MSPVLDVREALGLLVFSVGWGGGVLPVYRAGLPHPEAYVDLSSVSRAVGRLEAIVARWDGRESKQVDIGLPEARRGAGVAQSTVLWAWVESKDSAWRAWRQFRPVPSVVLRVSGSCRRLLLWGLREESPYVSVESANRRIAYALRAPQKYARPEMLRIPVPGGCLRVGRKRPAAVVATRAELGQYARSQVAARLREPPVPYMTRLRNGEVK